VDYAAFWLLSCCCILTLLAAGLVVGVAWIFWPEKVPQGEPDP
jgi:hypothetical protein